MRVLYEMVDSLEVPWGKQGKERDEFIQYNRPKTLCRW